MLIVKNGNPLRIGLILFSTLASPIVYEQNGKEYLVIMAGGHHFMMTPPGDTLVAYALPDR